MIKCEIRWIVICIIVDYIVNTHGRSWDVAVTIGQEVNFLLKNSTTTGRLINNNATSLNAIAYDEKTHTMYVGDKRNKNTLIFNKNITEKEQKWNNYLSNRKKENNQISGLTWDTKSQTLFYIDLSIQSIMQLNANSTSSEPIEIIHLPNQQLRDLALDYCTRKFYWTNSNKSNPTISSSDFNGKNINVIIDTNLYEPSALTIDEKNGKLYWIDDEEGIHYKIESSNLDGTNRKLLFHGRHQQPVSIAVDMDHVYWADWVSSTIWRIKKNPQNGEIPLKWKSFYETHADADPTSLITRDNIELFDCKLREKLQAAAVAAEQENNNNHLQENQNLATSVEEQGRGTADKFKTCLNGGQLLDQENKKCFCKNGFIGTYCEISVCWNYCFEGECTVANDNQPVCKCSSMYRGTRCQDKIESINTPQCICNDNNSTIENSPLSTMMKENKTDTFTCTYNNKNNSNNDNDLLNKTLITALSFIIGLLVIIIITLGVFVVKLRRRPRIKKRFIVSKNGITPLTTRPELPRDQCEIMIENCCNMNICETPCFEPKIRTDGKKSKKDDKLSLLDAVDGNNSC